MCLHFCCCCCSQKERKIPEIDIVNQGNQGFIKKYDTQLDFYKALKDNKIQKIYEDNKKKNKVEENIESKDVSSFYISKEIKE